MKAPPAGLTLAEYAAAKGFDVQFLRKAGVREIDYRGRTALAFKTWGLDKSPGRPHIRLRLESDGGGPRFVFGDEDRPQYPWGLWFRKAAVERGHVWIAEGETDALTLALAGEPVYALPGADRADLLELAYVEGIPEVYIAQDRDAAGEAFGRRVRARLQEVGWTGTVYVVRPPAEFNSEPCKDINDLWLATRQDMERFRRALGAATEGERYRVPEPRPQEPPEPDTAAAPEGKSGPVLDIVRLSDVAPEAVKWLWEPYVPLGKLTLVDGNPGVGKSWLTLALAAAVSTGAPLPGPEGMGPRRPPANVLLLTAEDGLGDTVRPRLEGMGADLTRIFAVKGVIDPPDPEKPEDGEPIPRPVTLFWDGKKVEEAVERYRPALVVLDPVQAYLGGDIDMNKAEQVRGLLLPLAAMAERHGCAVVIVRHLRKAGAELALYRGMGSIDFAAAARSVLAVAEHPEDQGRPPEVRRRVVAQVKNSLAPQGPSIAYTVTDGRFEWAGIEDLSAEALLAPPPPQGERSAVDEAREFLLAALADGPRPAKDVLKEAKAAGISERTIDRAKPGLVRAVQVWETKDDGKRERRWYWKLDSQNELH